MIHHTRM